MSQSENEAKRIEAGPCSNPTREIGMESKSGQCHYIEAIYAMMKNKLQKLEVTPGETGETWETRDTGAFRDGKLSPAQTDTRIKMTDG